MSLVISDDVLQAAKLSESDLMREIAIMLFQQERITLGKASQLADMTQLAFQQLLAARNICLHYDIVEYEADIKSLKENGWR